MKNRRIAMLSMGLSLSAIVVVRAAEEPAAQESVKLPPVQMFVPGFRVHELPIALSNINNVRYRSDGKLLAAAYDGTIWLLADSDGDGLEDQAHAYWDRTTARVPLGIAFTPPGYPRGNGVFLPCVGKVVLLIDKDGDDRADEEIVVATGWPDIDSRADAMGVALAANGKLYIGIGIGQAYSNAYRTNKETGQARYDLRNERGTIIEVAPDFSSREIVATGIRFPVALAFNRHGDLFATDQEGATWLPNGNPFDELLHIQRGRHYGFPPRHPRHLPGVIDEPSVFDYAPQHQSTCGLNFNEPVNGGPVFGPVWWDGDALVTGFTRGKIYRTKLVKTEAGYVAQNQQIAALQSMPSDVCVSPQGDLVIATHGGKPDWGNGPRGGGQLYKVRYAEPAAPQPVAAYCAGSTDLRVAFDRPIDPARLTNLARQTTLTASRFVVPGERYESLRPGYAVSKAQTSEPRQSIPVLYASVAADRRTLLFNMPPQNSAVKLAITLPGLGRPETFPSGELPQDAAIDLLADFNGIAAQWKAAEAADSWAGWLPDPDLNVSRELMRGSADHERLWRLLETPGQLTLAWQLDLAKMLQPAVQPGSNLDYEAPAEVVSIVASSDRPFRLDLDGVPHDSAPERESNRVACQHIGRAGEWIPVRVRLATDGRRPQITWSWSTEDDSRPRAFALRRHFVPWVKPNPEPASAAPRVIPELAGGNWERGRRLFFGDVANCHKCHQLRGGGSPVGPDLSNLVHRDYESVLRDILEPSSAINPDHLAYTVELTDGRVVNGVINGETATALTLFDSSGLPTVLPKRLVEEVKPSTVSLMPEGLSKLLSREELRDLLTYLLLESQP